MCIPYTYLVTIMCITGIGMTCFNHGLQTATKGCKALQTKLSLLLALELTIIDCTLQKGDYLYDLC